MEAGWFIPPCQIPGLPLKVLKEGTISFAILTKSPSPSKLSLQVKGLSWETEVEQENQNAKVP